MKMDKLDLDTGTKDLLVMEATKKEIIRGLSIFLLTTFVLLFLRFILRLLGASAASLFAGFIYLISDLLLLPFFGIFPQFHTEILPGQMAFDAEALVAIFCYLVLYILAIAIVWLGSKMLKTGKQVEETVQKDNPVNPAEVEKVVK